MFEELKETPSYSQMNVKRQEQLEIKVKVVKMHSSVERHCPGNEHSRVHLLAALLC